MSIHYLKTCMESLEDFGQFSHKAWQEVTNGEVSPLDILVLKNLFENYFETLLKDKDVISSIDIEISKFGDKEKCIHMGFQISQGSRQTFDYTTCGDVELESINKEINAIAERKKARELFLKSLPHSVIDSETGLEINPPEAKRTNYFIVK